MLSQRAKYAFKALLILAKRGPLSVSEIANAEQIPRKFLEQILLELKRHGIVASRRGKFGGYQLLKAADGITFGEVLRIVDGPIAPIGCLSRIAYQRCHDCRDEAACEIRSVFAGVAESARAVLDATTLATALEGGALDAGAQVERLDLRRTATATR